LATFRKRNGKWHVQIRRAGYPSVTKSFSLKADGEAWSRRLERDIDNGYLIQDRQHLGTWTLKQLLERYEATVTPNKRGAEIESFHLRALKRHRFSDCHIKNIGSQHVACFRDDRLRSVSSSTVKRELGILRHCFEVARKDWGLVIDNNPVSMIVMPKSAKPRERRLNDKELNSIIEFMGSQRNIFFKGIVLFAIETAMRRGEILNLEWGNIHLEESFLHIPRTKNGRVRDVPLSLAAKKILTSLNRKHSNLVFPVSRSALQSCWRRMLKKQKITDFRFHDLRHEATSRLFEKGLNLIEVATITGHQDLRMLKSYTHLKARELAKKL